MTPNIPLSSTVAAWLVTIGQVASGVGAMVISAEATPFGWDAQDVGLTLIWIGTIASIITVALRKNVIPGVTSGSGTEGG